MNRRDFLAALKELHLGTASKTTVRALGISVKQIQRLVHGEQKPTRQLELLIHMYRTHGIPRKVPGE